MISHIDEALRSIVREDVLDNPDVDVVFEAPTKDWAARRNAPTINLFLYDIREDLRRRENGWIDEHDQQGTLIARRPAPRYFRLSYLVSAWTQRAEDEHRLLADLLTCFLRNDCLPAHLVTGPLAATGHSIPITVGLPPSGDRAFTDVWSALGGELKPSLDVVVTASLPIGVVRPSAPLAVKGLEMDVEDLVDGGADQHARRHVAPPRRDGEPDDFPTIAELRTRSRRRR